MVHGWMMVVPERQVFETDDRCAGGFHASAHKIVIHNRASAPVAQESRTARPERKTLPGMADEVGGG
jgi:hypothetical protein